MKTYLYIITNISMPGICKVGITDNIEKRLRDLNKTSTPTRFQIYEKFEMKNAEILEQRILQHFATKRINRKREFLEVHPERICDFVFDNKNIAPEKESEVKGKFAKLGIKEGEVLKFKEGEEIYHNITAEVVDPRSIHPIHYKGKKLSLSESARIILKDKFDKDWKAVQGTIFWTYQGKTIRDLMNENNLQ